MKHCSVCNEKFDDSISFCPRDGEVLEEDSGSLVGKALAQMQNGNGTVGKLLTDSLLYTDIRRLVQQTDSLMADFKKNPRKYINLRIF